LVDGTSYRVDGIDTVGYAERVPRVAVGALGNNQTPVLDIARVFCYGASYPVTRRLPMPGKMAYLAYESDDGNTYSLKTRERYLTALNATAGAAALGFGAYNAANPPMPRGMKPRGVYVQDPTGGATRFLPVGSVDANAWTGVASTVQVDYSGIATLTDAVIVGKRPEKPAAVPHDIFNVSDAS
jgi:hypothetical protein